MYSTHNEGRSVVAERFVCICCYIYIYAFICLIYSYMYLHNICLQYQKMCISKN